jgi:hypothetical protein
MWRYCPALIQASAYRQRVDEAAALGPHVEGGDGRDPQHPLEVDPISRREVVRAGSGVDDRVEVARLESCHVEGLLRRLQRHLDSGLAFAHPATFLNTGSGSDPLVRGIHQLRQLVVGDHSFGDCEAGSEKLCSVH